MVTHEVGLAIQSNFGRGVGDTSFAIIGLNISNRHTSGDTNIELGERKPNTV
jgi:hypothetical protein